ncbi:CHAT domain-containing protein [Actinoplanes subtropicus]|uniref:CHAT domain-containing protein n=1 Tax=Actinoplanes subtropicus TaxID=543632 RepID=UPI0004C41363|nr:CHAT domain-containing protein [Actinoplanes subtropicus]
MRAALRLADGAGPAARGRVLVSLAWVESERGNVALGFRLLDEAEPLLPAGGRAVLHAQRGLMLWRKGRNGQALAEFDRAVAGLNERDAPLDLVKALNNRSIIAFEGGRAGPSREDLYRGLRIATRHDFTMMTAVIQVNLGCVAVAAGDLPAALGFFATARPAYEVVCPGRLGNLAMERSRALIAAGLFGEADRELAAAVAMSAAQSQDHIRAEALQTRAEAALLAGRPAAAAAWSADARADFLRRGNRRRAALAELLGLRAALPSPSLPSPSPSPSPLPQAQAGSRAVLAPPSSEAQAGSRAVLPSPSEAPDGLARRCRRLAGRLRRFGMDEDARVALLVAARALAATRPRTARRLLAEAGSPGRLDRLDTRLVWRLARAELAASAGRPAAASRELAAGMATLHRYRGRFGCLDLQTGASAHGRDLARAGLAAAVAAGRPADIFRWAERGRAQALRLPQVRPPDDPETASALEELRQTRQALRAAEVAGAPVAALRGRADALQRRIRESAWQVRGAAGGSRVATLAAVRARLGGAVLVSYVSDGVTLHTLVADDRAVELLALGSLAAAEEAIRRLRADLDTGAGRAMPARLAAAVAAATRGDARTLQDAVLTPLLARIGDRPLVVVPTGLLMTVPWGMLPACAGRPVTVAPSATSWLAAAGRAEGPSLVVAGPGILRSEEEITEISSLHLGSVVLSGSAATPAATLAALDGAGVAHLAAHGRHEAENPLFSSLDLHGGPLLGYDLPRLERPPGVVVLASCELGVTEIRPGDESFGMASALLAAGTSTVIASVGRVADVPATDAMVGLHRALVAGVPPAAALAGVAAGTGFVCLGA